jgi:hypothetical protein
MRAIARFQVSVHRALDHDFARFNVGLDPAIRPNRDAGLAKTQFALYFAVYVQIGRARDFTINL